VIHGHEIESNARERPHRTITRAAPKGSGGYTPAEHEEHSMTVAAVILAASPASALADAAGTPAARRLTDVAWAGGATPVVVCSFDPDGTVAAALANAEVTLADPASPEGGPVGQIANGIDVAMRLVTDTQAVLVWPARLAWVDAETVTTLIATHGEDRATMVRPAYEGEPGFPVLLPVEHLAVLRGLAVDRMPSDLFADLEALGIPLRIVDTGDPGVVLDVAVAPDDLPPYEGPPEPADTPEWGSAVADQPDDAPVAGPNRLEPAP
jgi:CTP:molybdopterin cytidylyltransferase MocA